MCDFIYNDDFHLQGCDGDRRKNPGRKWETKEKKPRWLPSHPHFYDMEADCFPVPPKHRKQAGPTLSGKGFLI